MCFVGSLLSVNQFHQIWRGCLSILPVRCGAGALAEGLPALGVGRPHAPRTDPKLKCCLLVCVSLRIGSCAVLWARGVSCLMPSPSFAGVRVAAHWWLSRPLGSRCVLPHFVRLADARVAAHWYLCRSGARGVCRLTLPSSRHLLPAMQWPYVHWCTGLGTEVFVALCPGVGRSTHTARPCWS